MPRSAAILCNGPSLADHNLNKIACETIGLNGSWRLIQSSYHVMTDEAQWTEYRRVTGNQPSKIHNLYTGEDGPDGAIKLKLMDSDLPKWSWKPFELGVYMCSTVTWVALQLAVAWGYRRIYMVGLDLTDRDGGAKFYGDSPCAGNWRPKYEARQRELFGYAAGLLCTNGVEIVNLNPRSKCRAFPLKEFTEVFM